MKLLITGATGVAGAGALRVALADPRVSAITVLSRRPLDISDPKLSVVAHDNFVDYSSIDAHDACLWCLGIAQSKVSAAEYERITYDYALAAARSFAAKNPAHIFCFLSGQGADSKENSRILFARVKGRTENALLALGTPKVYCFRPGFIRPPSPVPGRGAGEKIATILAPIFRAVSNSMVSDAGELGRAMLNVAIDGADKTILSNADILKLAQR